MSRRPPEAERAYANRRNRLKAYGRWQPQVFIDSNRARDHIRMLNQADISIDRVAALSGLARSTLSRILYHQPHTIRPETEQQILAIRPAPENRDPGRFIDATGTRRRLQALVAVGWSLRALAPRLGMTHPNVTKIANGERGLVWPDTARAITALYDQLWDQTPPQTTKAERISYSKARATAAQRGWVVPLAWDDDTIDDPAAVPELGTRTPRAVALAEDSKELERLGFTPEQVAERLGVKPQSIGQARRRARERVPA